MLNEEIAAVEAALAESDDLKSAVEALAKKLANDDAGTSELCSTRLSALRCFILRSRRLSAPYTDTRAMQTASVMHFWMSQT